MISSSARKKKNEDLDRLPSKRRGSRIENLGKITRCRQRRKREEKRCVSLNSPLVAGTMSVSARRFLQRRAEASSGAAAFAAGDASSPRASVPGDAARFSPGTAGGRFGARICRVPRGRFGIPGEDDAPGLLPDDIVPTPRHGDDTSGDEGVHPNDDPSSPTWHAAPHRSPLAFSFRGHSSSNAATKRSAPSATRRPPSIPAPAGWSLRPARTRTCCRADTRGHYETVRFTARARARLRARSAIRGRRRPGAGAFSARFRKPKTHENENEKQAGDFADGVTPTTARVSSWASPTRARHASAHPGGARGAPDRGTFSQAMREAETIASLGGEVAGARAGSSRSPATCWKLGSRARPGVTNASGVTDAFVTPHATAVTAVKNRSSFCSICDREPTRRRVGVEALAARVLEG